MADNNHDYLYYLTSARDLGKLERAGQQNLMTREKFTALPSMVGIDYETVQDCYRSYRIGFTQTVKAVDVTV